MHSGAHRKNSGLKTSIFYFWRGPHHHGPYMTYVTSVAKGLAAPVSVSLQRRVWAVLNDGLHYLSTRQIRCPEPEHAVRQHRVITRGKQC